MPKHLIACGILTPGYCRVETESRVLGESIAWGGGSIDVLDPKLLQVTAPAKSRRGRPASMLLSEICLLAAARLLELPTLTGRQAYAAVEQAAGR